MSKTPAAKFMEPEAAPRATRSSRVTIRDVAAATDKANQREQQLNSLKEQANQALAEFKSENPDWTHTFGQISLTDVVVDPRIQRPEQPVLINQIARDFNPMALGMVTVSRRVVPASPDGGSCALCGQDTAQDHIDHIELVLVDGQQRRAAALRVGYTGKVHADVHEGLTLADEARLFRQLNLRKSVSPVVLYKNLLHEGNVHALAVQEILDGLHIPVGGSKGFMAVKGAVELVKRGNAGVTHLEWALRQVKRLYDRGSGGVYDGNVVTAFFLLHERYGNRIDEKRLYDRLASDEGSNAALVEFANTLKRVHKGNLTVAVIRAIIDRYNKGLWKNSRAALPEWDTAQS